MKWLIASAINLYWNLRITYTPDSEHYQKADFWTLPADGKGDCEDYCIAKKQSLEAYGYKARFAACWTEDGQYHAVLLFNGWVLDNRFPFLRSNPPYKWDKEEVSGRWYSMETSLLVPPPQGWIEYTAREVKTQ